LERRAQALTAADAAILALLMSANLVVLASDIVTTALYPALAVRYGVPLETVVLLSTPRALAQLGVLALGPLSERVGRARLLVGSLFLAAAAAWGAALAQSLGVMAVIQLALGLSIAVGNAGIPALVGDRYAYGVRGRAMAVIRLAMPLTLIGAAPGLVALGNRVGVTAPFAVLGLAATAISFLAAWRLPGAAGRGAPVAVQASAAAHVTGRAMAVLGLALGASLVPQAVFTFLAAWVGNAFGNPGSTVALAITCDGCGSLAGVAASVFLVDRLNKRRAALLGLVAAAAFAALLPATSRAFPLACVAIAAFSASLEMVFVALPALLSEMAPEARGAVMGLWAVALAAGASLAPVVGRALWMRWGMAGLGQAGGTLLLVVAVGLAIVAVEPAGPPREAA